MPSRAGASLLYAGITGVSIAANAEWTQWSSMQGLAPTGPKPVDAWDYGVGTEIKLPGIAGTEVPLRAGLRWRTLPFQADSQTVRETVASFGFGDPALEQSRARFDFGAPARVAAGRSPGAGERLDVQHRRARPPLTA